MKNRNLLNAVDSVVSPIMAGFNAALLSPPSRLEELRTELRNENISYGELAELQDLGAQGKIDPSDVELAEAAGIPEHPIDLNAMTKEELLEHANKIGDTTIRKSWTKAKIIAAIEAMSQPA